MIQVRVPARVGLLGNPSDGFGGRVIAATIGDLAATVTAEPCDRWSFVAADRTWDAADLAAVRAGIDSGDLDEGLELMAAAVALLSAEGVEPTPCRVSFGTTIPRQVGLSGSSAIVVGVIRSVASVSGHELAPVDVARIALAAEVDGLGWAAGPQDRVVQSLGGLLDMRFDEPWDATRYERLDPAGLPPLVVAWDVRSGVPSGTIHAPVRERWEAGDAEVVAAIDRFAELAGEGRAALDAGSAASTWPALADEAFDLRSRFWSIDERDRAMVATVRAVGGGAALAGSGGAIVGHFDDPDLVPVASAALAELGVTAITPSIA